MYPAEVNLLQRSQQMILLLCFFFWWGLLNHVSIMHPRVGLSNKKAAVGNMLFVFFCRVFVILSLTNGRRGYIFPLSRKSYNTTLKTDAFKISRA